MKPWVQVVTAGAWLTVTGAALAGGVDVSWDDCAIGTAHVNKNFACSGTSNQSYSLIFQFKTFAPMPSFIGLTALVDLRATSRPLDPFWHFETGGCNRSPVAGVDLQDAIPASCEVTCYRDLWGGDGSLGLGSFAYDSDFQQPGQGRFVISISRPSGAPAPVLDGENYYAFHLVFNNKNRDVCVGCSEQAFIQFTEVRLESSDGQPAMRLSLPDKWSDCASINSGFGCALPTPSRPMGLPPCVVPALRRSWAGLKSLYR